MRRLISLVALAGCHATTSLEPPEPAPGARSILLLALAEGYQHAFAIEIPEDGSAPRFPTFTRPDEIDLYAVNFACPLDVLGIEPGRQIFLEEPSARLELPPPEAVLTSHDGSDQTPWAEADLAAIDPVLRTIELPPENLCRLHGVQLKPLEVSFTVGTSTPAAVIPLRNGKVIVANADHTFFEVDADRNVRPLPNMTGAPNSGGFERIDGEVFLVGRDGTIARGDPDRGMQIIMTSGATISELSLIDGSRAGAIEIYRTSLGRPFERWAGGTEWQRLTEGGAEFQYGNYSVAWIQSNEAIATGVLKGTNSAVRYKDGQVIEEPLPGSERGTAIAHIPGIGVVVGTQSGVIIREQDGRFVTEPESGIDTQIRSIVPTEHGFFYGRVRWASWDPVAGYCEAETTSADAVRLAPLGDRGFIGIGDLFGPSSFLFTLDRADVRHPCLDK